MRRRLWDFLGKWLVYRGNANTMFALAGKRHGWQRKGGHVMMRNIWPLSFRKSTVVASIRVRGGQPFLRGFYGSLRYEPCTQFINVSQRALHIYFIDGCRVCPVRPDARYIAKNKNSDLWASSKSRFLFCLCAAHCTRNSQVTEQFKLSISILRHFILWWKCTKTMLQIWRQYTNFR